MQTGYNIILLNICLVVIQNEKPLLSAVTISLTQCHREVESERHQMIHPEENHYCQN